MPSSGPSLSRFKNVWCFGGAGLVALPLQPSQRIYSFGAFFGNSDAIVGNMSIAFVNCYYNSCSSFGRVELDFIVGLDTHPLAVLLDPIEDFSSHIDFYVGSVRYDGTSPVSS